jgi:hypothetical protein
MSGAAILRRVKQKGVRRRYRSMDWKWTMLLPALLLAACGRQEAEPVHPEAVNLHLEQRVAEEAANNAQAVAEARGRERERLDEGERRIRAFERGNRQ